LGIVDMDLQKASSTKVGSSLNGFG